MKERIENVREILRSRGMTAEEIESIEAANMPQIRFALPSNWKAIIAGFFIDQQDAEKLSSVSGKYYMKEKPYDTRIEIVGGYIRVFIGDTLVIDKDTGHKDLKDIYEWINCPLVFAKYWKEI